MHLTEARDANCVPIVNSSGTGKSPMVDELSKRVVTVPICLCGSNARGCNLTLPFYPLTCYDIAGFPPPDERLRDWLQ